MATPKLDLSGAKSKLGPLPVWVWGLGAGAVALWYAYYRNNQTKAAAAGTGVTVDAGDLVSGLAGTPAVSDSTGSGSSSSTDTTTYETNVSWRQKAVSYLSSHGTSPLDAQIALDNYIQNGNLTAAQAVLVNAAIKVLGLPPDGTFNIPTIAPPKSKPDVPIKSPTPASHWVYTTDTKKYYLVTGTTRHMMRGTEWEKAGKPTLTKMTAKQLGASTT